MRLAIHSMCNLFHAPPSPFTLQIVQYNSIYYNYIIITQWLVVWFGNQGIKGVVSAKKCTVALCSDGYLRLGDTYMISYVYTFMLLKQAY